MLQVPGVVMSASAVVDPFAQTAALPVIAAGVGITETSAVM
jgi:hypothetical protein